ncbi:MAG TPA: ABC transporter permease [Thermoanaerobaculia bacterium]|nr:ABC transporter permease [Thermoanaerobaculia bacterium]HPA52235.1 ABC transporter permease [Thermoanaerobaculia bacterium]HQN08273.1 ABC transporter permease [Thermoanaerobaculia bacterium]HQP86995.1 ABC transporter permease [Thermoanaerobaculia bacterium]
MVSLARRNLLHDRLRFAITIAGVAFAVTLVFVQVGLFLGLLENASVTIEHTGADLWVTSRNTPNVDFAHTFPETLVQRVRSVPGVARADNLLVWFMQISLPTGTQEGTLVYALEDFAAWDLPWSVKEGRLEDLPRGDYLFLDDSATRRFGPFAAGEYREVNERRLKIIGRTVAARSFTTTPISFVDYGLAQELGSQTLRGKTTYVLVKLAPGADLEAVRAEIRRRLPYNDVFTKAEWAKRSRSYWVANTGIGLNMYLTVFLGVLVGVVVVALTLYTSTMEHLKEFGTVKAIGGSNRDIYRILAEQSVIAAVLGFAAGALFALAAAPGMAKAGLQLIITPGFGAAVLVGTVLLCLAASLVSFRKVAALDPALVFRG